MTARGWKWSGDAIGPPYIPDAWSVADWAAMYVYLPSEYAVLNYDIGKSVLALRPHSYKMVMAQIYTQIPRRFLLLAFPPDFAG
jgi:hypothetical protein